MVVKESYSFYSENIPITVTIESSKDEFVLVYNVTIAKISPNTEIILDKIKDELSSKVRLGITDIADYKKSEFIKTKFQETIVYLLNKYLPTTSEDVKKFLTSYLMHKALGLGKIELLLDDKQLEEITINNAAEPVWVYHRKYGWLKTNIKLDNEEQIKHYAALIGRKAGRSISLLTPLLDAQLETGERVNATLNPISLKGNTITLRKQAEKPITITDMINQKTISITAASLIWLGIEYELSTLITGGTATGKCVSSDTRIVKADGNIEPIKDIVEKNLKNPIVIDDGYVNPVNNLYIFSTNKAGKIEKAKVTHVWKRKCNSLLKIKTRSGREIKCTKEHPFFIFDNGETKEIKAEDLKERTKIACSRIIPSFGKEFKLNIINKLIRKDVYTKLDFLTKDEENIIKNNFSDRNIYLWLNGKSHINLLKLKEILIKSKLPLTILDRISKIKSKTASKKCYVRIPTVMTKELAEILGYTIGDGHIAKDGSEINFTNTNYRLRERYCNLTEKVFGIKAKNKNRIDRTPFSASYSKTIQKILNLCFKIPIGNKASIVKIPKEILNGNKEIVKSFLRSIYDCEAYVGEGEIEFSSASKKLIDDIKHLLLRFGIISYLNTKIINNKEYYRAMLYSEEAVKFKEIGFNLEYKQKELLNIKDKGHKNLDLIPNISNLLKKIFNSANLTRAELSKKTGLSPRLFRWYLAGKRNPTLASLRTIAFALEGNCEESSFEKLKSICYSDLYWDEVIEIKTIENKSGWVYDLSVENKNFLIDNGIIAHNTSFLNAVCSFFQPNQRIISAEDTAELKLPKYLHWIPMLTRLPNVEGKGEVTLLDLIINSLRMRPDRIVVGEIRRQREAETLFEAMHTGHSVYATLHANDVEETINRITNPPINVPKSLLPAISMIVVMYRNRRTGIRRIFQVAEILRDSNPNILMQLDVRQDKMLTANRSLRLMPELELQTGLTTQEINNDLREKSLILTWLAKKNINELNDIGKVIATYYTNKNAVLQLIKK